MSEQPEDTGGAPPQAPYSPDTPCPKCAGVTATARLCTDPFTIQHAGGGHTALQASRCWTLAGCWEHLHRNCATCGYEWLQLPLDAPAGEFAADRVRERRGLVQAEVARDRRWVERQDELRRECLTGRAEKEQVQVEPVPVELAPQRRWWQR